MYIQSPNEHGIPLPQDYSGNTFREKMPDAQADETPPVADAPPAEEAHDATKQAQEAPEAAESDGEATPVGAFSSRDPRERCTEERGAGRGWGSLFSGASSLLSSLLPPARGAKKARSDWTEWLLIGVALLLFLNDSTDDLLPLLLLLLLWD